MLTKAAESGWQALQWMTRLLRTRLTIEIPHRHRLALPKPRPKRCVRSLKLLNQLLSIFSPCLALLFKFDNAPSYFRVACRHQRIDATGRRGSLCLQECNDPFVYIVVVPLNHVPSRVCHL